MERNDFPYLGGKVNKKEKLNQARAQIGGKQQRFKRHPNDGFTEQSKQWKNFFFLNRNYAVKF